jgi:hypothetical protein
VAVLDDCRTLEEWTFTADELANMALHIVSTQQTA